MTHGHRRSFMHNGTAANFIDIRRQLCGLLDRDSFANVIGSSDSEHMAALYMSILTRKEGRPSWEKAYPLENMLTALFEMVGTVIDLQKEALDKDARPSSLNFAVTDGEKLICVRFRNSKTQQPPSLYWSTTAGQTLNRKYPDDPQGNKSPGATKDAEGHGKHIIVASEPTTYKDKEWHLIDRNCYVAVGKSGEVEHRAVPYKKDWDLEDKPVQSQGAPSSYRLSGCNPS